MSEVHLPGPTASSAPAAPKPTVSGTIAPRPDKGWFASLRWGIKFRLLYWLFLNQWAFLNVIHAARLKKTGKCTILSFAKIVCAMPLVTSGVILSLLKWGGVNSESLGLIWCLVLILVLIMLGTEMGNRLLGWVLAIIAFVALVCVVMQLGFDIQVWRDLKRFVHAFGVEFQPGIALLAALAIVILMVINLVSANLASKLVVIGNNYIPHNAMGRDATCSHKTHVLVVNTRDWLERFLMANASLKLRARMGNTASMDPHDLVAEDVYALENVPGAHIVKELIDEAMSIEDVEEHPASA